MKPKPLSELNHFTVPCAICLSPSKTSPCPRGRVDTLLVVGPRPHGLVPIAGRSGHRRRPRKPPETATAPRPVAGLAISGAASADGPAGTIRAAAGPASERSSAEPGLTLA